VNGVYTGGIPPVAISEAFSLLNARVSRAVPSVAAVVLLAARALLAADAPTKGDRWPAWRGAGGQGIADGVSVPLEWSPTKNVVWKVPIPGRGLSSPVVWGDRIFLTTALEGEVVPGAKAMPHVVDGQPFVHPDAMGADHHHTFKVLCLEARDGRVLWERTAWEGTPMDSRHKKASFASPTAVTDGERVYAYFGSEGLYAYDYEGKLAWTFGPGVIGTLGVGTGTSPILYGGLVILLCDEEDGKRSFIVGLDAETGREVWRTERPVTVTWATPVVTSTGKRDELLTTATEHIIAYDPATGRELWRMRGLESNAVTTPLVGDDVAVFSSGYPTKVTVAVEPGGSGDITGTDRVLWRYDKGSAYVPSPILYRGLVYLLTDRGRLSCLDARTGQVYYEGGRLGASFMASPVAVDGYLLVMSQEGDTYVVKAGSEFEIVGQNPLGEPIGASPAVAGSRIYIRGESHLFAIGDVPAS